PQRRARTWGGFPMPRIFRAAPGRALAERCEVLGAVLAAKPCHLGLTFVPGFFQDRRDLGIRDEALPALLIPVEQHPDPVVLIGIAKDDTALRPVLHALLGALGR